MIARSLTLTWCRRMHRSGPISRFKLFAQMDEATPPNSILASSSSGITMDVIQSGCKRPERCVIGHPFNPPHVVPLVEVVGGAKTSAATIERAMAFYASIGKKPVRLHKALPGHVANRFQAALYKEVLYLVQQGVLSVADADIAVCYGPGIRWGVMGPSLQVAHRRRAGRHPTFHGTPDGSARGMDEDARHARDHAAIEADRRRRRAEGGGGRSVEQLAGEENAVSHCVAEAARGGGFMSGGNHPWRSRT